MFKWMSSYVLTTILMANAALGSVVFVETEFESGNGFLRAFNDRCLLITPAHVVENGYEILAHTRYQKSINLELLTTFQEDLSILSVAQASKSVCDRSDWRFDQKSYESNLTLNENVSLQFALMDGTTKALKVYISGQDAHTYFYIKLIDTNEVIQKGMSGSFVYAGNLPIGMLISTEDNQGKVLRLDYIELLTKVYFPDSEEKQVIQPSGYVEYGNYIATTADVKSIAEAYSFCEEHNARGVEPQKLRRIPKENLKLDKFGLITVIKDGDLKAYIYQSSKRRVKKLTDGFDSRNTRAVCEK